MKKYYNKKKLEGLDLKEGNKVWLLHKNFKSKQPNKKLDHVKLGPFKIVIKISKVMYRLDLLAKIKIYLVQHVIMLKPAKGDIEPPLYEIDMYKGQEKD